MSDARDLPDLIQWHEGMLLAPQHFQQADLRSEGLLHYHTSVGAPFHWGIRRLQIDGRALASGIFHVSEIEAILPDGALVTEPLEVDLNPHAEGLGGRGTLTIHLAVPVRRGPAEPVAGSVPRHVSVEGHEVPDENLGEGALRIPRLRPAATLLVSDSPAEKFTSFPLAKVSVQQDNSSLDDFVPPALSVVVHDPAQLLRREFDVNVSDSTNVLLLLRLLIDDGCVVYLNGQEVVRQNMPQGEISHDTWASEAINNAAERAWTPYLFSAAGLANGRNLLAVEVHQKSATSTDIRFDLELPRCEWRQD